MSRWLRVVACLMLLAATSLITGTPTAQAATSDRVDTWSFRVTVNTDGSADVNERLVYRFGGGSGRHGIIRELVVREPWDESHDASYDIEGITVSSPDASADFTTVTRGSGRNRTLAIRIGSADRTITSPTATYTISYTVRGALRGGPEKPEFYWDLLSGEAPDTRHVDATVTVPGGVTAIDCSDAAAGERQPCTRSKLIDGTATFGQENHRTGSVLTVATQIGAGKVAGAEPTLVDKAVLSDSRTPARMAALFGGVTTALAPIIGAVVVRFKGRDLRYVGLPPGVVPAPGQSVKVARSGPVEIPVAFAPPRIPVAEAGLLVDGQVDVRETTATLVDLAVRGAVTMASSPEQGVVVGLVDASLATAPHEKVLLSSLFPQGATGSVQLSHPGEMEFAHRRLVSSVTNQVAQRGWFTDVPRTLAASGGAGIVGVMFFIWIVMQGGLGAWWPWLLAIGGPVLVWKIVSSRLRRGQRTALGRAATDQIVGFETYLTTAETEQLRFEEGEDIFSRYLPWAIIFGVAERWTRICAPLVEAGRIPQPVWYVGNLDWYVLDAMLDDLTHTAGPPPPTHDTGVSGTGFGAGSAFGGGGGFSGGGGGGGSVSSW